MSTGTKPKNASGPELWGLTGGVASGKSAAARFFAEAGVPVIDADVVARDLSNPGGAAYEAIVARFGTGDRSRLREIVFGDPAARAALETIMHQLIRAESLKRAAAIGGKRVLYEAALLVETGRYRDLAGLIVVEAPLEARRARLIARDGITAGLADSMIAAQATDEARRAAASFVLANSGTLEELKELVRLFVVKQGWGQS